MRLLKVLSFGSLILITACSRQSQRPVDPGDMQLKLSIEPSPAEVGEATLVFVLTDIEGNPIQGAQFSVKGDMSHAGMMPVQAEAFEHGIGTYRVPFEWTMGGDWVLTVTGELADGKDFQRTIELSVRSP